MLYRCYSGATSENTEDYDAKNSVTTNSVLGSHSIDLGESGYFFILNSKGDINSHPLL